MNHNSYLKRLMACDQAREYAKRFNSLQDAWDKCERGDWMLWLIGKQAKSEPWSDDRKPLLACALDCAETVKHLWPEEQKNQIANVILVLRSWINCNATQAQADKARRSLYATAATAAAYAANYANYDAYAADAAAYAAYAAYAAADAAYAADAADAAAAYAAAAAAYAAADADIQKESLRKCAEIVRQHFPTVEEI